MFETQGGHAESNPRPAEEGVSFYHVLRPLDHVDDLHSHFHQDQMQARAPRRNNNQAAFRVAVA